MRRKHVNSIKSCDDDWFIFDGFAGGGGASLGIEWALGRSPDAAANHNGEAVAMHSANHPDTRHFQTDMREIRPRTITNGRKVGLAWFSPDCTFYSKSRGGKPFRQHGKKVRGLAWVVVNWAKQVRPRVIMLENVEEFLHWGPVVRKIGTDGTVCLDKAGLPWYVPCPQRRGVTFNKWVRRLQRLGYVVEWRELRGCDYGSPTIRKRLHVICRCDGEPIVWPEPTHGAPRSEEVRNGTRQPWRTAANDVIDWSLPCPSIFLTRKQGRKVGVKRPLAKNTMARIFAGLKRYVLECARPYIVCCNHGGDWFRGQDIDSPMNTVTCSRDAVGVVDPLLTPFVSAAQHGGSTRGVDGPLHTVTASEKDQNQVATAFCVPRYTEREGQAPRCSSVEQPCPTIVPTGNGASLVLPTLDVQFGHSRGRSVELPCPTIMSGGGGKTSVVAPVLTPDRSGKVAAFVAQHNTGMVGHRPEKPLSTVTTRGTQQQVVAASLITNTSGHGPGDPNAPVATLTTGSQQAVAAAYLSHFYTIQQGHEEHGDPDTPRKTVTAGGKHHAAVLAFLTKYYSTGHNAQSCRKPLHTAPTRERFGLVTINEVDYIIADIGMRMFVARELFRAQGFPDSYVIDVWCYNRTNKKGKALKPGWLTKEAQVRCAGNSVCPHVAQALVAANCSWMKVQPQDGNYARQTVPESRPMQQSA